MCKISCEVIIEGFVDKLKQFIAEKPPAGLEKFNNFKILGLSDSKTEVRISINDIQIVGNFCLKFSYTIYPHKEVSDNRNSEYKGNYKIMLDQKLDIIKDKSAVNFTF